jgi:hypothetical protein
VFCQRSWQTQAFVKVLALRGTPVRCAAPGTRTTSGRKHLLANYEAALADFTQSSFKSVNSRSAASNSLWRSPDFSHDSVQLLRQLGVLLPFFMVAQIGKVGAERGEIVDGVCGADVGRGGSGSGRRATPGGIGAGIDEPGPPLPLTGRAAFRKSRSDAAGHYSSEFCRLGAVRFRPPGPKARNGTGAKRRRSGMPPRRSPQSMSRGCSRTRCRRSMILPTPRST